MRASIDDGVLYLNAEDMPRYKKGGSVVRNSYFWALRSIAARSPFDKPWEFEQEVWFALNRMLLSFFESGYLGTRETQLEFLDGTEVPEYLRPASTWVATFDAPEETEPEEQPEAFSASIPESKKQTRPSRRLKKLGQNQRSGALVARVDEPEEDSALADHQMGEKAPADSVSCPGSESPASESLTSESLTSEPSASDPQVPPVTPSAEQSPQPRRRSWRSTRLG